MYWLNELSLEFNCEKGTICSVSENHQEQKQKTELQQRQNLEFMIESNLDVDLIKDTFKFYGQYVRIHNCESKL